MLYNVIELIILKWWVNKNLLKLLLAENASLSMLFF